MTPIAFDPVTRGNILAVTPLNEAKVVTRENTKSDQQYRSQPVPWTYIQMIPKPDQYMKLVNEYFIGIQDKRQPADDKVTKRDSVVDKKKELNDLYKQNTETLTLNAIV
jgi:hypothetical protein